jgi:hypothetical protein
LHLLVAFQKDRKLQVRITVPHFAVLWIMTSVEEKAIGFLTM